MLKRDVKLQLTNLCRYIYCEVTEVIVFHLLQANVICVVYSVEDFTSVEKVLFVLLSIVRKMGEMGYLVALLLSFSICSRPVFFLGTDPKFLVCSFTTIPPDYPQPSFLFNVWMSVQCFMQSSTSLHCI